MSRSKWEDMVNSVLGGEKPAKKETAPKQEPTNGKMSIEDIPGDPGSTVGTIREYKKRQREALSDL